MDGWYPSKLTSGAKRKCFTSEYSKRWKQTEMHNFPACPPQNKLQWYIKQSTIIYRSSSGQKIHRQNRKTWRTHTYIHTHWWHCPRGIQLLRLWNFSYLSSLSSSFQTAKPVAGDKLRGPLPLQREKAWRHGTIGGKKLKILHACATSQTPMQVMPALGWWSSEDTSKARQYHHKTQESWVLRFFLLLLLLSCAQRSWHVCDHLVTMQCVVVVHTSIIPSGSI